jgi:arabinofuranan 3-O-arabinosyltransferase
VAEHDSTQRTTTPTTGAIRAIVERHGILLAYLVPSLISVIAVQTWFEPGTAVASGDLAPPITPGADYVSHWSHLTGGEGAPTFDIVGLPYSAWIDAWGWFGVAEDVAQRLWLTGLFAGSAAAVVFLAFGFTASPLAAGAAGLLASFNAYRLITGPDAIPMTAILVASLLGGLIVRAALRPERRPSVLAFAAASLGLGYVMTNPPHVLIVTVWVAACAAIAVYMQPGSGARILGYATRAVPLALLFNLWWIVPAFLTVTAEDFDERFTAATVDDWTWTHERATLANALTLNTYWAWSYPEYFPYASELSDSPFDIFVLALPALAIAGIILAWDSHRRLVVGLSVTAVVAAGLTTGLNGPITGFNRWLYDNMPGYWLFREPTKLLLLVALPIAILAGIGLSRFFAPNSTSAQRALGALLAGAAVLSVYPLFNGDVVPDERPLLPSAHVRVPDAWENVSATLNAEPGGGKVLVLPRSDYYQVPTTWGYYGTSFTQSIISRPVLEVKPGTYFDPPRVVSSLIESIETDLARGRVAGIGNRLAALGVRYILLRGDIDLEFLKRKFVPASVIARGLADTPRVRLVETYGLLRLYRVGRVGATTPEVFAATPLLYAGTDDAVAPALSMLPGRPGLVTNPDDQRAVTEAGVRPTRALRIEHEVARSIAVRKRAGTIRVRLRDPFQLTADGGTVGASSRETIAVPARARGPLVVTAGDSVMPIGRVSRKWTELGLVGLQPGAPVRVWRRSSTQTFDPAAGRRVRDCNDSDSRDRRTLGLRATVVKRTGGRALRLSANAHSACVGIPLTTGRSRDLYVVRFRYRHVRGRQPRVCLWQVGVDRCASLPALRPARTWKTAAVAVMPRRRMTGLRIFVYADGTGQPPGTANEYQGVRLERYGLAGSVQADSRVRTLPLSRKTRALAFASSSLPPQIDLDRAGPVGDCQRLDERTAAQVGLDARVVRDGSSRALRLSARDHSACVDFAVSAIEQGARAYRVRFEYRALSGSLPRVCLWQVGPDHCASLPALRAGRAWSAVDETVSLDSDVQALRLFLYADGTGEGLSVAEYRNVHVGPVGSVALVGIPRTRALPRIIAHRSKPSKFNVRVENARGPFVLATGEAFAPGWKATATGHDDSGLRHIEVNGYANGWLVPWKGSYNMTLEYRPERYASAARAVSLTALLGVFGLVGLRRLRAFDVGRQAR